MPDRDLLLQDLKNHFKTIGAVRNLALKYDKELLEFLLEESEYKEKFKSKFFTEISHALIFKKDDFLIFIDFRNLFSSWTIYTNKIGLASKTKFLKANSDVVLNFPFKDGVLKGGQIKDNEKHDEIFFNEILAKDEIDVLFSPKALQNFELIISKSNLLESSPTFPPPKASRCFLFRFC